MTEMTNLFDIRGFYRQALFTFKRAFEPKHVNDNPGLFAVNGKGLIIFDRAIGVDSDNRIVF